MNAHLRAQLLRFARITVATFVADYLAEGGRVGWSTLWTLLPGAVEAGLRQVMRVEPAAEVTGEPVKP